MYVQCTLIKYHKDTTLSKLCWIEEKLAVKGKKLKLKTEDGWDYGWYVSEIYDYYKIKNIVIAKEVIEKNGDKK